MQDNLYSLLTTRYPRDPDDTCLSTPDGQQLTYRDIDEHSARYANCLVERGLSKGERVAVQVGKSPPSLLLYLACLRAGLIYLPLNPAYTVREVRYFLRDATPALFVCEPVRKAQIESVIEELGLNTRTVTLETLVTESTHQHSAHTIVHCGPDDVAALLYTSGTTGQPKGVMLTHGNLGSNALTLHEAWGWQVDDVMLHALPLFHVHGLFVACHGVLLSGASMYFLPAFDVDKILQLLPQSTVMMGVPTFYTRLLATEAFTAEVCRNIRVFVSGSAPLLEETFHSFEQRTGHTILERYGMSETAMNTSNPLHGERIAGTVGPPLRDISVRITDDAGELLGNDEVGHVQIKGPNVFRGYWNLPDKTAEEFTPDGYFKTGDLGKLLPNGYLQLVGRAKDLIISGGYNIYPKEIEFVLDDLDGVSESSVFGIPHPDFGEAVTAAVVPSNNGDAPSAEQIVTAAREQLAGYKVPKQIHFVDELPRNAMGKIQKNVLRERFARSA